MRVGSRATNAVATWTAKVARAACRRPSVASPAVQRAALVAIDPRTGGVLALVSYHGFDTNLFVNGISTANYSALRDSPDVPLFNRAVQGQYPPGSTIKPIMAMAVTVKSALLRPPINATPR